MSIYCVRGYLTQLDVVVVSLLVALYIYVRVYMYLLVAFLMTSFRYSIGHLITNWRFRVLPLQNLQDESRNMV
jgi:hypothetical protein